MNRLLKWSLLSFSCGFLAQAVELNAPFAAGEPVPGQENEQEAFDRAVEETWQEVFFDSCTGDWNRKWFQDGEIAAVDSYDEGMKIAAGPRAFTDAHHTVLWTKDSFEGDLKIEFDYTRTDFEIRFVNILYIEATGSGIGPYATDITEWNDLRKTPAMKTYFNNMNTYHLSFAAFGNNRDDSRQYIRGRRYLPNRTGLKGTDMVPDYFPPETIFAPGVPHRFVVIKKGREMFVRIENPELTYYCHFTNQELPPVNEGRIGLRHMAARSAVYKNLRVSRLIEE